MIISEGLRNNIKGLELACCNHKLHLFADDVLMIISNPVVSLPNLRHELECFQNAPELHIDNAKSKVLNINSPEDLSTLQLYNRPFYSLGIYFPLYFPYLSVSITSSYNSLYKYQISWIGHIAVVKITYLPKLLYLFEKTPVQNPPRILRTLQNLIYMEKK